MNCTLASTGSGSAWILLLLAALALILLGTVLRAHRARRLLAVALIFCAAGALALAPAPGAQAACPANSLTIVQTSTNSGLSPTQAPSVIVGRVTNNGPDETIVTAVVASIGPVTKAAGAAAGACDASDYVLLEPRMPVGEQLAARGGAALFSGARIGFADKGENQDACKNAVVRIDYATE